MRVFRVLEGEALATRESPVGTVGAIWSGEGIELQWVSKADEEVDPGWFESQSVDVLVVLSGLLRVEFERQDLDDRTLEPGYALILEAGTRCRAYRWPREATEATVFLAAYPQP